MRNQLYLIILILFITTACENRDEGMYGRDTDDYIETNKYAVIMTRSELENSIEFVEDRLLQNEGKTYLVNNYLLTIDRYFGIRVIDNTDKTNPQKLGYIKVPGIMSLNFKNNILIVNNSVDLVFIDISNLPKLNIINRIKDAVEMLPEDGGEYATEYKQENLPQGTVIVGWN